MPRQNRSIRRGVDADVSCSVHCQFSPISIIGALLKYSPFLSGLTGVKWLCALCNPVVTFCRTFSPRWNLFWLSKRLRREIHQQGREGGHPTNTQTPFSSPPSPLCNCSRGILQINRIFRARAKTFRGHSAPVLFIGRGGVFIQAAHTRQQQATLWNGRFKEGRGKMTDCL